MKRVSELVYAEGQAHLVVRGTKSRHGTGWVLNFVKVTTRKPELQSDEIAILLRLKLPAALFEKPLLTASISVEGDVPAFELDAVTKATIEDVLRSTAGLDVQLSLVKPE